MSVWEMKYLELCLFWAAAWQKISETFNARKVNVKVAPFPPPLEVNDMTTMRAMVDAAKNV